MDGFETGPNAAGFAALTGAGGLRATVCFTNALTGGLVIVVLRPYMRLANDSMADMNLPFTASKPAISLGLQICARAHLVPR